MWSCGCIAAIGMGALKVSVAFYIHRAIDPPSVRRFLAVTVPIDSVSIKEMPGNVLLR